MDNKPPIEISLEALGAFKKQLSKSESPPTAIRIGVRGSGCSGLSYVIEFCYDAQKKGDAEWTIDDVTFRVDKKSVLYLSGSRLTWKKTLVRSGFEFENPHEVSRCGCGESFNTKQ